MGENVFNTRLLKHVFITFVLLPTCVLPIIAQEKESDLRSEFETIDGILNELYKAVSFEKGEDTDWDYVRTFFIHEAVIILRTSATEKKVLNVEDFVQLFLDDIERLRMKDYGFTETVKNIQSRSFGEIAHAFVVYRAQLGSRQGQGNDGLDSFQLIWRSGRWWIASVINEAAFPDRPIPEEFLQ